MEGGWKERGCEKREWDGGKEWGGEKDRGRDRPREWEEGKEEREGRRVTHLVGRCLHIAGLLRRPQQGDEAREQPVLLQHQQTQVLVWVFVEWHRALVHPRQRVTELRQGLPHIQDAPAHTPATTLRKNTGYILNSGLLHIFFTFKINTKELKAAQKSRC